MTRPNPLAAAIETAKATAKNNGAKFALDTMAVLSAARDPYRLATKAHQRNADWLADSIAKVGVVEPIHLRGLHYRLVGSVNLPNGNAYVNDDKTWIFLSEQAALAARFLQTVDFDLIIDNRNATPESWTPEFELPKAMIDGGFKLELPSRTSSASSSRRTACRCGATTSRCF